MRILFATTQSYLPQRVGGSQLSTHDLALTLSANGHQAAVLCDLHHPPLDWTRIQNRVIARVLRRTHPCDRWWPYRVYRGYDATTGVQEVARAFQPDLAIVQAGRPLVRTHVYRTQGDGGHVLFINPDPRKGLDIALALAQMNPDIPFVFLESWPRSHRHRSARERHSRHRRCDRRTARIGGPRRHPRAAGQLDRGVEPSSPQPVDVAPALRALSPARARSRAA